MWALPFARNRPEWASRWLEKLEAGNVTNGRFTDKKADVEEALTQIEEHQYDVGLKARGYTQLLHWDMAFFKQSCRWECVRTHTDITLPFSVI